MIVRGITDGGQPVYLELEIHPLARRLILHVQTDGQRWIAVGLDKLAARELLGALAVQCEELSRWAGSATSSQDARVALSGHSPPARRPQLPNSNRSWPAMIGGGGEDDER
jgi:hypothetical protein